MTRKQRVLFVCVGNSCRSQMAEGFARTYGRDVMEAESAGLAPAPLVATITQEVMAEKNIDLGEHFPKGIDEVSLASYDLIVNISGYPFPVPTRAPIRNWDVPDPIGGKRKVHERAAQQVENLVMQLILDLRRGAVR